MYEQKTSAPFGNASIKTRRYEAFWQRADADRPLVCFSLVGWFPLAEFSACRFWNGEDYLTPDMVDPNDFLEDHIRLLGEGDLLDDDAIRGASPSNGAVPWMPGIAGAKLRILPENVVGEEQHLSWEETLEVRLDARNEWYQKYMEFAGALTRLADGRFPISHGPELGPTDMHALLRGHTDSIVDLMEEPERSRTLLASLGNIFLTVTNDLWDRLPRFCGGYYDAPYLLWAPGPIIRIQEDATAVYSPDLYRQFVQPIDRMLASRFECSFMHVHSSSMFMLDAYLEVEEIRCFQVTKDAVGPTAESLVPYYRQIQEAGRPLLARGEFSLEDVRILVESLDRRGLMLNVLVKDMATVEKMRSLLGM